MKEEKEVIWLIRLFFSEYVKSKFFKYKVACIKDFEIVCKVPINDKNFRDWMKKMQSTGVIEFFERKNNGGFGRTTDYFVVNKNNIIKRLREIKCYGELVKFFDSRATFGVDNV